MSKDIIIIGGGFAGLAAGVALGKAGRRVLLLEQKPYLGGRARSFREAATGSIIDNGQHLLMGCYHETFKFLETIGTSDAIRLEPQLRVRFLDPGRKVSELKCPNLPSPWHLLAGVFLSNSFSFQEKLDVLRMGKALRGARSAAKSPAAAEGLSVDDWLGRLGQSQSLRRNFWDLICIAAMNEDPRIASATLFERVLQRALFTSPLDSRLGVPRQGLSDCYTDAAVRTIRGQGGEVELRRDVRGLILSEGACKGVRLVDGSVLEAETVVSAVPWYVFPKFLSAERMSSDPFFSRLAALKPAPIISIYLWFDRPVTSFDFAGLRGTTIQWLFNKGRIAGERQNYLSLVLSGAHEHVGRSKDDLTETALRDLDRLLPGIQDAKLVHSRVIKERFATFSPGVEAESARPSARTPVRGLFLAGDWTDTGLPATIEGAVQSGHAAAREILRQ